MITFVRAAASRIAVYISSARDQTMAKPVPPPVIGCQSGETDHGLPGSSSRDGHRRVISSTNRAISGPSAGSGSSVPVIHRCSSASSSRRTSETVLGPEGGNAWRSKLTCSSSPCTPMTRRFIMARVTRIELALSAWEPDRITPSEDLTWRYEYPLVTVADLWLPANGLLMARRS
jgi:hypothetical protein